MAFAKKPQKVTKNANLLNKMAQNVHFWSPCLEGHDLTLKWKTPIYNIKSPGHPGFNKWAWNTALYHKLQQKCLRDCCQKCIHLNYFSDRWKCSGMCDIDTTDMYLYMWFFFEAAQLIEKIQGHALHNVLEATKNVQKMLFIAFDSLLSLFD